MRITLFLLLIIFTSCGSDKVIELPEINQASISELTDISPAYLFYDETQPDSIELNRKNLISTTNWVVNVDKRLTLKQVIPHIQFLQNKKNNSSHKNEAAKNYFTCHDLNENNLGFIEFTDVVYHLDEKAENYSKKLTSDQVTVNFASGLLDLDKTIQDLNNLTPKDITVILQFDEKLTFQEYISIKSKLSAITNSKITFDKNEFIY